MRMNALVGARLCVKTFIVSHDGVVFEKDLGPATPSEFQEMELFNPDRSWKPVSQD